MGRKAAGKSGLRRLVETEFLSRSLVPRHPFSLKLNETR